MGSRGPKPLPNNVHQLRGNPSKKTAAQFRDGVNAPTEIPDCPRHLKGPAQKEWKRVTVELEKLGLVSKIDRAALAMYCTAWGRYVHAEEKLLELGDDGLIETTPNGFQVQGPWLNIANKAMDQCKSFLAEFGMSPSSRSRVTPGEIQGDLFDGTEHEKPSLGTLMR